MDYEKKYKQALERAKDLLHIKNVANCGLDIDLLNSIFPELNESELQESKDENIRRSLIDFFEDWHENRSHCWGVAVTDILAWLEKQGEQKPTESPKDYHDIDPHFGIPVDKVKPNLLTVERAKEISPFMRSGFENESADKVEPKKAENLTRLEDELSSLFVTAVHRYCRDKGLETPHFVGETLGDGMAKEWSPSILELAKKELKIEKKPAAWSDEDEHRVEDTIYFLDTAKKHYACTIELDACIDWLKSIKDRIGG